METNKQTGTDTNKKTSSQIDRQTHRQTYTNTTNMKGQSDKQTATNITYITNRHTSKRPTYKYYIDRKTIKKIEQKVERKTDLQTRKCRETKLKITRQTNRQIYQPRVCYSTVLVLSAFHVILVEIIQYTYASTNQNPSKQRILQ